MAKYPWFLFPQRLIDRGYKWDPRLRVALPALKQDVCTLRKWGQRAIIAALKQVEAGRTVDDFARACGVSQATIYTWTAKYCDLEVREAQRLRSLIGLGAARQIQIFVFRSPPTA